METTKPRAVVGRSNHPNLESLDVPTIGRVDVSSSKDRARPPAELETQPAELAGLEPTAAELEP